MFTCNSTERLADRFLTRNRVLPFSTYAIQSDATKLLENVWRNETDSTPPNCARMIKEANGNIRAALMALEIKLYAESKLAHESTEKIVNLTIDSELPPV